MTISYKSEIEGVDWHKVAAVYVAVGWGERNPIRLEKAFAASSHVRFAYDGDELVGFGRTVDDGQFYALIVDLVIAPQYQEQGIGSTILSELRKALTGYSFTTLTSAVGKEDFYIKQGWKKQTTAFIWPRSENQQKDHT